VRGEFEAPSFAACRQGLDDLRNPFRDQDFVSAPSAAASTPFFRLSLGKGLALEHEFFVTPRMKAHLFEHDLFGKRGTTFRIML
jgi:hypothetical protein